MTKVFVMVGVQGSGKSTVARYLAQAENAKIINSDDIRKQLAREGEIGMTYEPSENEIVFRNFFDQARALASAGENIILDATHINERYRKPIFENLAGVDCKIITCVMQTDKEECWRRIRNREKVDPEAVQIPVYLLDRCIKYFTVPTKAEGFDEIRVFDIDEQSRAFRAS